MSQQPFTPAKIPNSAANNTPATLDPDLRSQINMLLLRDGHVQKIHESLLHSLHANSANWPSLIQAHALQLLRSGSVSTYPELLRHVLDDIRSDTLSPSATTTNGDASKSKGSSISSEKPSLALPQSVVDEALRVTRECLDDVCEVGEEDGDEEDEEEGEESSKT